jgi:hypothetical protein
MAGQKVEITVEIQTDAQEMLNTIKDKYQLPDISKTVRCLLDYVADDGDWDEIFKKIRCKRC